MRLCFETHLKYVLKNDKSLDNQKDCIGKYLDEKNVSKEIKNMIVKLIDYYNKYQNEHVKHNDDTKNGEVRYIIDQTSLLISRFM